MSRSRRPVIALHLGGAVCLLLLGWLVGSWAAPDVAVALDHAGLIVASPQYLWGLLLVPALLVLRAFSLSDLPPGQQVASFVLRSGVVVAVVLAMIDVQGLDEEPVSTATVFVVDVSESMPDEALERARERVQGAWTVRGRHEVRVVRFAGRAEEVQLPASPDLPIPPFERLEGPAEDGQERAADPHSGRATDLEGALNLAMALLPHERLKRVVIVSDGLETRGSCAAALSTAQRFDVLVHHLDLTDVPRPAELMVTGLEAPPDIKPRIPFEVTAKVESTHPMAAVCELSVDGVVAETVDVALGSDGETAGEEQGAPSASRVTSVRIGTRLQEGGDRRLAVQCTARDEAHDRIASNNRFEVPVRVPDKPRVLYVEGERRYRRNLLAALESDFEVELRGPAGVPSTLKDAQQFDAIVVSDVPRRGDLGVDHVARRHMVALERYVRDGGGLVWAGGENSFGPGGYGDTLLERKVLPIRFDVARKEDIPSLALVLVIDRSGSMSGPKIELAKEAARATLDVLQPSDKLGIIAFDSSPVTIVRLQRAANRLKITDSVSRLSPGGGTAIFPALDQAFRVLSSTQAKVKHIILLTDGQSNRSGVLDLVAQAYGERITISTVAVGMGSDQRLLMQIAEEGGGRYYFTDRADNIPKLFLKEASEVSRRALVEDRFRPRLVKRYRHHEVFKGLDFRKAPPLLGYVSTRPKPRAEVMLKTHLGEPLLARWRLGLGRAVVWTSDTKNKWAHAWLRWPGYAQFWRQLIRDSLRVERPEPTFAMVADIASGVLTVGVDAVDDADHFLDGLTSEVTVTDPHGVDRSLDLHQTAPGHYEGEMALEAFGPYTIRGRHTPADQPEAVHRSYQAIAWPFPTEHRLGEPDLSAIADLSAATGGVEGPSNAALFDTEGRTTPIRTPRWPLPLYAALALLLLDVLLRRVRLYGAVIHQA